MVDMRFLGRTDPDAAPSDDDAVETTVTIRI